MIGFTIEGAPVPKGRPRFTLTVPETDSASAHAFDVEFTNEDFEECHE